MLNSITYHVSRIKYILLNTKRYKKNSIRKNIKKNNAIALFVLSTLYLIHTTSFAQTISSPYSRYGIGDITGKGFGQNFAMGGTSIALQNDTTNPMFFINTGNPASFSNMRLTTSELGINYNRVKLESSSTNKIINSASLAYASLAFPIKKWWGVSVGLIPYSSVGYKVSDHQEIPANTGTTGVDFLYEGRGGINQLYFGNGIKPLYGLPNLFLRSKKYERLKQEKKYTEIDHILQRKKNWQALSLGLNTSYLFGNFVNSRRSIFPSSSYAFNTRTGTTTRVSDVFFDYGAQYSYSIDSIRGRDLKDNVQILIGATFAAQTSVNAKIDSLSYSYFNNSTGFEVVKDTIEITQNTKGKITLPLSFGFGVGFKKGNRWLVAADFAMQNWSSYQAFNQTQGLKNSMRVSVGMQYIPNSKASGLDNYYKRLHYRLGIRYAQTALELKSTQLTESAVSFGIGFPVGRNFLLQNFSMVNIGVEAGYRGTTTNGLIKENFFKATIGFTINDRWFVKPKFD